MHSISKSLAGVAAAGLIVFAAFNVARAQTGTQDKPAHGRHGQMGGAMMEDCKAMMAARQEMKSRMQSADAKLEALVEEMSAAEGDAKVEAMAKVVAELAGQRKSMMSQMMAMQPQMMMHMRMAMKEGGDDAMECPMMKEMGALEKGAPEPLKVLP